MSPQISGALTKGVTSSDSLGLCVNSPEQDRRDLSFLTFFPYKSIIQKVKKRGRLRTGPEPSLPSASNALGSVKFHT